MSSSSRQGAFALPVFVVVVCLLFLLKTVLPLHLLWIISLHHSVLSSNVPSKAAHVCHRALPGFTSSSCFVFFKAFMILWIHLIYLCVDFIIWCCLSVDYKVHENKYVFSSNLLNVGWTYERRSEWRTWYNRTWQSSVVEKGDREWRESLNPNTLEMQMY